MSSGGGSYFKGWASTLPHIPSTPVGNDFREIWMGHVLEIDYTNEIGKIRVRLVGVSKEQSDDDIQIYAYPADLNIVKYPLPGELVYLVEGLQGSTYKSKFASTYYYITTISSNRSVTFNSDPYIGQTVPEKTASTIYTPEYEHRFEKKLDSPESFIQGNNKIKAKAPLKPYEGDFILQGRFGSALRLGSTSTTKANEWSLNGGAAGNPIMILSVNRATSDDTHSEKVNEIDSAIYLCTSQAVPVKIASSQDLKSHKYRYDVKTNEGDLFQSVEDITRALETEAQEAQEADRDNAGFDTGQIDPNLPAGTNGNLSPSQLKKTTMGITLEIEAAEAWDRLVAAARADGVPDISASGGYRPYATQQAIFDWDLYVATGGSRTDTKPTPGAKRKKKGSNGSVAVAFPGTSNHGWGRAVDASGKKFKKWLKVNGWKYGWSWYEGRSVGEDWHFTYTRDTALLKSYVSYTDWNT
jgi:hypothetical protein